MTDDLITIHEAAEEMHYTRQALYYHVKQGTLPTVSDGKTMLVRRDDLKKLTEKLAQPPKQPKRKQVNVIHLYEIVTISCGELTVLFKTCSLKEMSHMYIKMMEHEHKLIRVRKDGKILTIHESDALGNTHHPRTRSKKGATA